MSSREEILNAVKQASQRNHIASTKPEYFDSMVYDRNNLLNVYMQYQQANMAHVVLSNKESLVNDINKILQEKNIEELLCVQDIVNLKLDSQSIIEDLQTKTIIYDKSVDENRDELFTIKTSILHARIGVANLGILGLSTGNNNPRLASLVVSTCIILLKKEDIVANLFEAFKILRVSGKDSTLPTNIIFLAGPSRTADIELQTVFGVHGPQNIHVILY